jgi:hypothetical protein
MRLVVFQLNVAVYPHADFTPQSLSVKFAAPGGEVQFVDVDPSSKVDATGSYEVGVEDSGKFTSSTTDTDKLAFTLDGKVAAAGSDSTHEHTNTVERSSSRTRKETGERIVPLVISSALGGVARWQLLRAPRQPLVGGFRFLSTAFVEPSVQNLAVEALVRVELEHYGPHEINLQKRVELPFESQLVHSSLSAR